MTHLNDMNLGLMKTLLLLLLSLVPYKDYSLHILGRKSSKSPEKDKDNFA